MANESAQQREETTSSAPPYHIPIADTPRRRDHKSIPKNSHIQEHLVYIASGLMFLSLIGYVITRDNRLLDATFTSPFSMVIGYYLGKHQTRG